MIPSILFALTMFLSILGYSTPSPWIPMVTMGNLLGGLTMLVLLWWMMRAAVPVTPLDPTAARQLRPWAIAGLVILTLQIGLQLLLGITTVLSNLPLLILTAHNANAALLLLALTNLLHHTRKQ